MPNTQKINPEILGKTYTNNTPYTVGKEHIREFAHATQAQSPLHHDTKTAQKAGYRDIIAPPTYAIILAQQADSLLIQDPESGIDFSRVVHADQRFTHHQPITAGDNIITSVHVENLRMIGTSAMLTTREELHTTDGELLSTCTTSLLIRGE
ncbi:FAS1-like dehydratase domain-containing protein [Rothia sp. P6271]|uniref:FAS1-like dehydratase domain-containing protein n=1 Tax=unclassified Rothia (in: high G+C Gram-positive bacteria) TaxID=2689056 RepID=UPI003ACE6060